MFALGLVKGRWLDDAWLSSALVLLGATTGGFLAARASPGVSAARAAVVGTPLVLILLVMMLAVYWAAILPEDERISMPLAVRLIASSGLGTLVGLMFGNRRSPDSGTVGPSGWAAVSMLTTAGVMSLIGMFLLVLLNMSSGDLDLPILLLGAGVCTFLGGMIAQYMAPRCMRGAVGLGAPGALLAFVPQVLLVDRMGTSEPGSMLIIALGLVPLMAMSVLPGFLGASLGWYLLRRSGQPEAARTGTMDTNLPRARIH